MELYLYLLLCGMHGLKYFRLLSAGPECCTIDWKNIIWMFQLLSAVTSYGTIVLLSVDTVLDLTFKHYQGIYDYQYLVTLITLDTQRCSNVNSGPKHEKSTKNLVLIYLSLTITVRLSGAHVFQCGWCNITFGALISKKAPI